MNEEQDFTDNFDILFKPDFKIKGKFRLSDDSIQLCGSFDPDTRTSSATKCKCGREKWEHPS